MRRIIIKQWASVREARAEPQAITSQLPPPLSFKLLQVMQIGDADCLCLLTELSADSAPAALLGAGGQLIGCLIKVSLIGVPLHSM